MNILDFISQAAIGLVIVLIVYSISVWIMRTDRLIINSKFYQNVPIRVKVLNGYIEANGYNQKTYNTVYPENPTYLPIRRSVNRMGGAQFTYQFWMYADNPFKLLPAQQDNSEPIVLFLKGDSRKYNFIEQRCVTGADCTGTGTPIFERTAICPSVMIGTNPVNPRTHDLIIRFNSTHKLHQEVIIRSKRHDDNTMRHNLTSLQPGRWMLYTITFMDNLPISDFENGLVVKTYINDTVYQIDKFPNISVRQNDGDFHVLPTGAPNATAGLRLADLAYHNYALRDADIAHIYKRGAPTSPHVEGNSTTEEVADMSAYNKLDIYNA